jgi:hypothetical protein
MVTHIINNQMVLSVAKVNQKEYKDGKATGVEKQKTTFFFQEIDENGTPITVGIKINDEENTFNPEKIKDQFNGKKVSIKNIKQTIIVDGRKANIYYSCNLSDITEQTSTQKVEQK